MNYLLTKNDNQTTRLNKNFSASFLLIYSKMFEGIIYNIMFSSFLEDDIITQNQLKLIPGNSNEFSREIYPIFDISYDVRGVSLDICKTLDIVSALTSFLKDMK